MPSFLIDFLGFDPTVRTRAAVELDLRENLKIFIVDVCSHNLVDGNSTLTVTGNDLENLRKFCYVHITIFT